MDISVIGAGYVGLVTAVILANAGHNVFCIENDYKKLNALMRGECYFYEVDLQELLAKALSNHTISFHSDYYETIQKTSVIFLCLPTPSAKGMIADLSTIYQVSTDIAKHMKRNTLIVVKSTVPVGTSRRIYEIISSEIGDQSLQFDVQMNPEFLRQGSACYDFQNPFLVVIGKKKESENNQLYDICQSVTAMGTQYKYVSWEDAEMAKYASNLFLANRISLINELSSLCEKTGADIRQVKSIIMQDANIGQGYLNAGIGYGGSCFPKDIEALIGMGNMYGLTLPLIHAVKDTNNRQKHILVQKLIDKYQEGLFGKKIAIWGLTFKPGTSDTREAPSIDIINDLNLLCARVFVYDPMYEVITQNQPHLYNATFCDDKYAVIVDADALLILTEWDEFYNVDILEFQKRMKRALILDGRDVITQTIDHQNVEIIKIGRS
jgi:UDPglucose 6-dehydrogenase